MEALGIDFKTIIIQIINFGLLVFVLNKFLYKPVLKAIKAKKDEIAEISKQKEELDKQADLMSKKQADLVKNAQKQKAETLKGAKITASTLQKETLEKAQKEAKAILAKAKKEVEAEKAKLNKEYEKQVLEAAFAIAEKVIGKNVDKKDVEKAYKELGQVKKALR